MRVPNEAEMDFTASAFIVDGGRVLMVRHTKLEAWLQPGGHIDPGETPDEAAVREVEEETGIQIELVPPHHAVREVEGTHDLPQPFNVNLHPVRAGHWHCDFGFLARPVEAGEATHPEEHDGVRWFSREDLEMYDGEPPIPENVRAAAVRALEEAE